MTKFPCFLTLCSHVQSTVQNEILSHEVLSFNKRDSAAVSHAGSITGGKPQLQGGERDAAGQPHMAGQRPQGGRAPLGPAVAIDLRWRAWRLSLGQPAGSKGHRCGAAHTSCSMHTVGVSTHPGAPYPLSVWATVNTHHTRRHGVTEGVLTGARGH